MTQANITTTIAEFLKSRYVDKNTHRIAGLTVDDKGDFIHYNKIIDQTFNEVFKPMTGIDFVSDYFKKLFCQAFYNREIGFETFARFQVELEKCLKTECFNYLKLAEEARNLTIDKMNADHDNFNDSSAHSDGHSLDLAKQTPQDQVEFTFTDKYGVITHVDSIGEGHNKNDSDSHSHDYGWGGDNYFKSLNDMSNLPDYYDMVLDICDDLFLQVW